MMLKRCGKCNTEKPVTEFYIKGSDRREKYSDADLSFYTSHCKACLKAKQLAYRKSNPEKAKDVDLYQSFGIRLEDYRSMYDAQDGCCAICERHSSKMGRALNVDHDHKTGDIRGLLCNTCNTVIGKIEDSAEWLNKCSAYLNKKLNGMIFLRKVG